MGASIDCDGCIFPFGKCLSSSAFTSLPSMCFESTRMRRACWLLLPGIVAQQAGYQSSSTPASPISLATPRSVFMRVLKIRIQSPIGSYCFMQEWFLKLGIVPKSPPFLTNLRIPDLSSTHDSEKNLFKNLPLSDLP